MSVTHFDTARTSQALLAHLSGWFGAKQGSAQDEPSDNSPVVQLKSKLRRPAGDIAAQLEAEQRRGREMERVLSQYISPEVLARLMDDPGGLSPGGETRDVTVLFADLSGFTALAEAMKDNPRRLTDLTNAFLDPMTDIVLAHGGTIDKYMGDCVMAFWGAPADDPDHARRAFDAARAMLAAMDEVNRRVRAAFADEIDLSSVKLGISIGVNSGECVVGNVGSRRRFDYSVLGDPVNVASRLEGLCKDYNTPFLMGEETARRLGADARLTQVDHIVPRGRTQRLKIFGLASAMPSELAA